MRAWYTLRSGDTLRRRLSSSRQLIPGTRSKTGIMQKHSPIGWCNIQYKCVSGRAGSHASCFLPMRAASNSLQAAQLTGLHRCKIIRGSSWGSISSYGASVSRSKSASLQQHGKTHTERKRHLTFVFNEGAVSCPCGMNTECQLPSNLLSEGRSETHLIAVQLCHVNL